MHGISSHCPLTLSALAATILYECPNYGTTESLFQHKFTSMLGFLDTMRSYSFPLGKRTHTLNEVFAATQPGKYTEVPQDSPSITPGKAAITFGALNKAIQNATLPGGVSLHIPGGLRYSVAFYRNSLSNTLAVPALLSLCEDWYGSINESQLLELYHDVGLLLMVGDMNWLPLLPQMASDFQASGIWTTTERGYRSAKKHFPYYLPYYYQEHLLAAWLITCRTEKLRVTDTEVSYPKLIKELQKIAKSLSYLPRIGSSYSLSNSALDHAATFLERKQIVRISGSKSAKVIDLRETPQLETRKIEQYLFCSAKNSQNSELIYAWHEAIGKQPPTELLFK
jgi:hypothetical protein